MGSDYLDINRRNWDERAGLHVAGYRLHRFVDDPAFLSDTVRFDLPRLGDVSGLDAVHLQCHLGTDTLSLARLGARMTGLDFSPASLAEARRLAEAAGADVTYVESDVYGAVDALGAHRFDLVYTGIGAIGWLPDIRRWARTVAGLLRPGGRLFIREGHPMLWTIDERRDGDPLAVELPYFETPEPLVWDDAETYVATERKLTNTTTHSWNHGLGEIVTAVLDAGLRLTGLAEHDSVPWNALPGRMHQAGEFGEWHLTDRPERLPLTYTLRAVAG
ncbi:class I SAM-dependent methyltransferase [Catenuloplanes atrovinosus]|uniref:SAM-dependent methyltransferase n=1 Tax=Catenuloplanes atrovinosus TaxID=137266 RepID=A0AAE3YH39_9ACTN|nr:class I SAM-dependent methyltransferase [Catenuloplanes atrovinosus]MDR7273803.1 SAM-dependent methyltransferase [Catenuloplanes atrovinosus]